MLLAWICVDCSLVGGVTVVHTSHHIVRTSIARRFPHYEPARSTTTIGTSTMEDEMHYLIPVLCVTYIF